MALLIVGIPTLAQFTVAPWLLDDLQRDWILIGWGQVWRLLTSLVVQDGGLVGAIFSGSQQASAHSSGASSCNPLAPEISVAVFGLAASMAVLAVLRGVGIQRLVGLISLLGAAVLLIIGDIHGGAATIGAVLGLVFARARQSVQSGPS